jgi:Rap1a immunity proteins
MNSLRSALTAAAASRRRALRAKENMGIPLPDLFLTTIASSLSCRHPTSMDGFNTGACFGLVDGIRETLMLWNTVDSQHNEAIYHGCIPAEVTVEEAVKVVMKCLNDNPTQLHQRDALLVVAALSKGYPCPASPK